MRALLRTRKQLVREQASHAQRIQKTLEDANLKLGSVLTQVMGKSGRAIIGALIAGERDPDALLRLVQRGVKAPPERLRAALTGCITRLRWCNALGPAPAKRAATFRLSSSACATAADPRRPSAP